MKRFLCARCLSFKDRHAGRGICAGCYEWLANRDRLDEYPRTSKPIRDVAEDYLELLPVYGSAFEALAARLKLKPDTLERTLYRAGFRVVRSEGGGRKIFGARDSAV